MARQKSAGWLIFMVILLAAGSASAVEKIAGERFQAACQSYASGSGDTRDAELCTAFLLGYLSAAEQFYLDAEADRTYHDRALDTRAKGLMHRDKRLKGKRFCVPRDEPLNRIVERINAVPVSGETSPFAENVVKIVLEKYYRCNG